MPMRSGSSIKLSHCHLAEGAINPSQFRKSNAAGAAAAVAMAERDRPLEHVVVLVRLRMAACRLKHPGEVVCRVETDSAKTY